MPASPPDSLTLTTLEGKKLSWKRLRGKVVLVVNTASACGFTPQLGGLQALHEQFGPRGLVILGFPCNQFGGQEPGDAEQIGAFCERNYGVGFQMMAKTEVNGPDTHPLFAQLKSAAPGFMGTQAIKWNFTKFLVDRDGEVIRRYPPQLAPSALASDIEAALAV